MAVDKKYCMSSYMAFRYIEKDGVDFYPNMHHKNIIPLSESERTPVYNAEDIDYAISAQMERLLSKCRRGGSCFQEEWIPQSLLHI